MKSQRLERSTVTGHAVHRYGSIAQLFHWSIALMIAVMYALGWYMADLAFTDPTKFVLYQIHKSIGITIFALAALRLLWRLTHSAPPWPATMTTWEKLAAAGAHWALYGLIFLQPLTGVLQSNAANFPIVFWGGIQLPALIAPNETADKLLLNAHHLLGNALAGLVLLHVAAALRHHIMLKDDVLRRMLPGVATGVVAAVLALVFVIPPFVLTERGAAQDEAAASREAPREAVADPLPTMAPEDQVASIGDPWAIAEGSRLGFIALQQGAEVVGSFDVFEAEIVFDPEDLENSRISVDIDVTSINSGQGPRDDTLKSSSFFEAATWPRAAFKSQAITAVGDNQYEAAGTLQIRDVTKDVVLPFSLAIEAAADDPSSQQAEAKGELPILRLDYGVGQGDWTSTTTVADEVIITIDIKATKPIKGTQPSG